MQKFSYLKSSNADYIDGLFSRYVEDPSSVEESWRYFFEGVDFGLETAADEALGNGKADGAVTSTGDTLASGTTDVTRELQVANLILTYRERGHLLADINPLREPPASHPDLELSHFGLTEADLGKPCAAGRLIGMETSKLSEIVSFLRETYCRSVGAEFLHIQNLPAREWFQARMEKARNHEELDPATRRHILKRLSDSEGFERFLHTRYVAQKRFSVEGGESVIPAIDCMIEVAAELGAKEFVFGMAHRGRLNVLHNIFGKKAESIFTEFEGNYTFDPSHGEGDVKYHKGYSRDFTTRPGKEVHLSLANNPSHLEFINAVVEGIARAKQERRKDSDRSQVIPLLIHGDAAFAGQGICYETLQMSQLPGYATGGTLHIVLNNQVGFTAEAEEGRSTTYCTDLGKMLDAPILHVNGDDPEAVWWASKIATEYRQKFKQDILIDLVCYRKYGHNEGDEPSFTSPLLYKKIKAQPSTREVYAQKLAASGVVPAEEAQAIVDQIIETYTKAQAKAKAESHYTHASIFEGYWKGLRTASEADISAPVKTAIDETHLKALATAINTMPGGFHLHPKLQRFFEARLKAVQDGKGIDWGNGEALAYASLIAEGHSIRLSGQDAGRGTFTHRHSMLTDFETGEQFSPLNQVTVGASAQEKGVYAVYNSYLSENAVMGFEYGYALADPKSLVIWEAQFGDFTNGAQVIVDQFLATSESKWQRMQGLVLFLPHGYEGQGPEHSNARPERFLQLCGKNNMQICNFTTPAQLFHALRRQLKREFRKPLIVMTPKSLLRSPLAVSTIEEFTKGSFEEALDDHESQGDVAKSVKRVLLCSGKICYELMTERTARKRHDVAVVRLEQLYPWPTQKLAAILARYPNAKELAWVQEEPRNMGAWQHVFGMWMGGLDLFQNSVGGRGIRYVGREVASSPAVGSPKIHEVEQKSLIERAFGEFK